LRVRGRIQVNTSANEVSHEQLVNPGVLGWSWSRELRVRGRIQVNTSANEVSHEQLVNPGVLGWSWSRELRVRGRIQVNTSAIGRVGDRFGAHPMWSRRAGFRYGAHILRRVRVKDSCHVPLGTSPLSGKHNGILLDNFGRGKVHGHYKWDRWSWS